MYDYQCCAMCTWVKYTHDFQEYGNLYTFGSKCGLNGSLSLDLSSSWIIEVWGHVIIQALSSGLQGRMMTHQLAWVLICELQGHAHTAETRGLCLSEEQTISTVSSILIPVILLVKAVATRLVHG